ncbi:hypothetical protein ACWKSP_41580 [Micromonosporaceae bacterium Da 78-11]
MVSRSAICPTRSPRPGTIPVAATEFTVHADLEAGRIHRLMTSVNAARCTDHGAAATTYEWST